MSWYDAWLSQQLKDIPYCIRELRVGSNSLLTKSCLDRLFTAIECVAQEIEGVFIDEIVARLQEIGILDSADKFLDAQKLLIFAVLGWQSMLYQAAFNVCSVRELAIHQDSDQPIQSPFVSANESVRQPPASSTIHNREICD
ncbi:hypothetical protein MPDQ_006691 [Monascus purpureus]|uniref:Uncharacterized protein n=1 Tax=Monascus purpureus TaxID=5098 RepID=A0A507QYD0_MONPU|nr:hypothetical protein MPDQ_006691 [Monascus purpureus]BDD54769.1 hypothetical protein MAP00_000359 [Monascus purpureus]